MFEGRLGKLVASDHSDKVKRSQMNGLKRRWNLGENYKPKFDSKTIPNLKTLKKIRIGKLPPPNE